MLVITPLMGSREDV